MIRALLVLCFDGPGIDSTSFFLFSFQLCFGLLFNDQVLNDRKAQFYLQKFNLFWQFVYIRKASLRDIFHSFNYKVV